MRKGIDSHWIRTIDEKLTFCGAYEEFYDECARYWKSEKTRASYDRDYNEVILPNMADHDSKPIDMYGREDFEETVQRIAQRGQSKAGATFVPYADSTLQHFRHLIEVVINAASNHGVCDNVLWGSCFSIQEEATEADAVNERVRLKKSLTVQQEQAVASYLFSDEKQRGQEMGLLLMFSLGLRNGEACGANYGDIRPMRNHPECKVLWVYKSTVRGTNVLQSSGKTRNADRIIPIPRKLEEFIEHRRVFLEQEIKSGEAEGSLSVDELPIACVGNQYDKRCSASQLTAAGREMFKRVKMNGSQLAYIDAELQNETTAEELGERDPTAYLLRRNFGTHLFILGLTEPEIEYVIGHDIQDAYETRNEFVNEERLWQIKEKLDRRPILNDERAKPTEAGSLQHNVFYVLDGAVPNAYSFSLEQSRLIVRVSAKEPADTLYYKVSSKPNLAKVEVFPYSIPCAYDRTIDIIKAYRETYRNLLPLREVTQG